jgi:tRNA(Ser,Leu) C12 N-acetylase TAN1
MRRRLAYLAGLENWNVLATAREGLYAQLGRLLRRFGDFRRTRFLGVLAGHVRQPLLFCEELLRLETERPGLLVPISKLLPIDKTFEFSVADFEARLAEALMPYAEQIQNGSFYIRIERRGHKGEIHSQQVEQAVGAALIKHLTAAGYAPSLNFKDPDLVLVVETLDETCGVTALSRDVRERFRFMRVH